MQKTVWILFNLSCQLIETKQQTRRCQSEAVLADYSRSGSSGSAQICGNFEGLTVLCTLFNVQACLLKLFSWFTLHLWGRLFPEWEDEQTRASWQWCCPGQSDPVITVDTHICLLLNTPRKNSDPKTQARPAGMSARGVHPFNSTSAFLPSLPIRSQPPHPLKFPWSVCCRWEEKTTSFYRATWMVQEGEVWQRTGSLFWQTA